MIHFDILPTNSIGHPVEHTENNNMLIAGSQSEIRAIAY